MRYGQNKNGTNQGIGLPGNQAGNITTTASQQKSNGHSLFTFTQSPQNISGYSVGGISNGNERSAGGAQLRRNNKQRSHSSSNNAAVNQSNIVFIGG